MPNNKILHFGLMQKKYKRCGKTVVSNLLNNLGYPVYNSDKNAKKLMNFKTELISKIIHHLSK